MKHARDDYNERIKDSQNLIPEDEPVFLIRGQDIVGGDAVREWSRLHVAAGGDTEVARLANEHAAAIDEWPVKKLADR